MTAEHAETFLARQRRLAAEAAGTTRPPLRYDLPAEPSEAPKSPSYGLAVLRAFATRLEAMTPGSRDATLNDELFSMGKLVRDGVLTHEQVIEAGLDIALRHVDDSFTAAQVHEKFARAVGDGAARGRDVHYGANNPPQAKRAAAPDAPLDPFEAAVAEAKRQAANKPPKQKAEPAPDTTEPTAEPPPAPSGRHLVLTRASDIAIRPVRWTWKDRLPVGSLCLLAGREGIGKSTVGYQLAADITQGKLPGEFLGTPKTVIVAATEDSWEHTIVPRLMAAGADLERVLRVDVITHDDIEMSLTLPLDVGALTHVITDHDAGMVLLDPLMSRLASNLDTHKDADTRRALEPLTKMADAAGCLVLGLIHVNKSAGSDPLTLIMGSRAFSAVARAVLFAMKDPDDEHIRLLGQEKNNLGRTDLPVLTFSIESEHVANTDEGPVFTGRVNWIGETDRSIRDAINDADDTGDTRSSVGEAADWLEDYLTSKGGEAASAEIKTAGAKAGHSGDALKKARRKLGLVAYSTGFPRTTAWRNPLQIGDSE